jgi:type VI secretion system protein ImpG
MSEELYPYYERELLFIRQFSQEFAKLYPAAAGRLLLEPNRSVDPHVERLIEAFSLIAGRIHHKLDDEFPELTQGLLGVLYPHYLAPIPSTAIVQFELDPTRAKLPNGFAIDRHSRLHSPPIHDTACRFRTVYPVTLWPIALTGAGHYPPPFPAELNPPPKADAMLVLQMECQGGLTFADLSLDRLRFFIDGDNQLVANIYELLFQHVVQVLFRPLESDSRRGPIRISPQQALTPVGFERDESVLPYPRRSFSGYRLLTEFFAFPSKFWFFDLAGFRQVRRAGYQRKIEIIIFLDRYVPSLKQAIQAQTFRLGCTPVVNLFEQTAEPIPLTQQRHEYRIVPDVARTAGMEVYSVDAVTSLDPASGRITEYQPFYSLRHGITSEDEQTFWYSSRKRSLREGDKGTDVYLNLVDLGFHPQLPAEATLIVRTTCTNRDLPLQLNRFGNQLSLVLEAAAPLSAVRCLRMPGGSLRPALRRGAYWRLMSHLNLNHLSLTDGEEGREALQEILRLYDFSDAESVQQSAVVRNLIDGITSVRSRTVVGRRTGASGVPGFCQGVEVTLEFDEQKYMGTGVLLFASVLERFLGLYVNINSFSQLIAKTKQGEGYYKKWPPRAGEQSLL